LQNWLNGISYSTERLVVKWKSMLVYYRIVNKMAFACLANLAIFAGGLVALSTLSWYKGRGPQERKRVRKVVVEQLA
jgi:hypothetical protein